MNIQAQGLRTVIYKVDDLAAAKKWYSEAFGTQPYFDEPFYVGFNIGGYELGLLPEPNNSVKTENVLAYWAVDDIVDAYDKMVSHGAKELEAPNDVGGGIRVALVKDPWQNVVGLIYNPHFKAEFPDKTVLEYAPFQVRDGVTEEEFLQMSSRLEKEFLITQPGFIRRELLRKGANNWADLIYWKSEAEAKKAMKAAESNDVANRYFQLIESSENGSIQHFHIISD